MWYSGTTRGSSQYSHDNTPVPVERRSRNALNRQKVVQKPHAIVEYNKYMGGVNRGDQLLTMDINAGHTGSEPFSFFVMLQW